MANSQTRKIIKERRLQDDHWKVVSLAAGQSANEAFLPFGSLLVPLAVWKARKDSLVAREYEHGSLLGIWLAPEDDPAEIADDIGDFTVIAVHFPEAADGRGYSTARLLRERYGFAGELRAFGDIGRDQLFYLNRVGFDSFVIGEEPGVAAVADALKAFDDIPEAYQGASDRPEPLFRRRAA